MVTNNITLFFSKVKYKIKQYKEAYLLKKPEAILALDFIKKDKKFDYRHRYNLPENSIVFDLGGFKGEWSAQMIKLNPKINIYVFEVVKRYISYLNTRFKDDKNIKIFPFGLGNSDKVIQFAVSDVATGIYTSNKSNEETEEGEIREIYSFISENKIKKIDLIKMNIEGGEYELLESLITGGFINNCVEIQIQFHNYGEWCVLRRDAIKEELRKTHICTYDFEWTFENWKLKN